MDHVFRYAKDPWAGGARDTSITAFTRALSLKDNETLPATSTSTTSPPTSTSTTSPPFLPVPRVISPDLGTVAPVDLSPPIPPVPPPEPDAAWLDPTRKATLTEPYCSTKILPLLDHGWNDHAPWFKRIFDAEVAAGRGAIRTVVEVGTWFGRNTAALAKLVGPTGRVFGVDTWKGSSEHQPGSYAHHRNLPYLRQQFLSNMVQWEVSDRVTPMSMTSCKAASTLEDGVEPDLVFIDGAHDKASVKADLEAWYPKLAPNGILCGDLWSWESVRGAIEEFVEPRNLEVVRDGENNWHLVDRQFTLVPVLPRGVAYPAKRPSAVFTMVRQEHLYLPMWYKYYAQYFDDCDMYVIHHCVEGEEDDCMSCLPEGVNKSKYEHDKWCSLRWNVTVGRLYRNLLTSYEAIFFTDVDEILIADSRAYPGGLREYIDAFRASPDVNRRCTGYDLVHVRDSEAEFDQAQPVLRQRKNWQKVALYNKPLLTKKAFTFAIGFHDVAPDSAGRKLATRVDPELILLHLHRLDFQFYMNRHAHRRDNFAFSSNELKNNFSYHYRTRDDKLVEQFVEECGPNAAIPKWLVESEVV
jgi:predicted O-methyltransferase YrrM